MALVVAFGQATNFANPVTKSVNVGSSANRCAYVLLGRVNSSVPLPQSVTVGSSDSLTARGSTFTDADGRSWRLFAGALTVTGTQTISGDYDSDVGFAAMIGVVWDGVDTATVIESLQTGAAYNTTPSFTVTSTTGDDVIALLIEYGSGVQRTLTPSSPATEMSGDGLGTGTGFYAIQEAGSASVTIDGSWSGTAGWVGCAFNIPAAGGGGYTLTADGGSYSSTGQAAATNVARKLAAGNGAYTLTGSDATLLEGHVLIAAQGTYTITGSEAHADYAITCALGSYVITGQAATVRASRSAAAAQGSYALNGQPAQIGPTRLLQAAGGAYALSGQSAATRAARKTTAGHGSYAVAGQDAGLVYALGGDHVMAADAGAYALSGQSAAARAARRVVAEHGLYALAGQASALKLGRLATAQAGSYTLTGQALAFEVPARLAAAAGSYVLTGQAAALTYSAIPAPVVLSAPPAGRRLQGYGRPANIQRSTR